MENTLRLTRRSLIGGLGALVVSGALLLVGLHSQAEDAKKKEDTFRFIVYGDTRDGHAVHRKLVAMIMKENPDFVLQTGDLVHRGTDDSLWKIYDDITGEMRKKVPVYPARGKS